MNWADVADGVKSFKGKMELLNPALVKGSFGQQIDVMARNMQMSVPEAIVGTIVGARLQNELVVPLKAAVVNGLQAVIDAREKVGNATKRDIWTPRLFTIAPNARATEVGIGIWDSGVDLALFKPTAGRGIAFDREARPSKDLLRPLGDSQANWPQLKTLLKGAMDLQAALDTEDARRLKQAVALLEEMPLQQRDQLLERALDQAATAVAWGLALELLDHPRRLLEAAGGAGSRPRGRLGRLSRRVA